MNLNTQILREMSEKKNPFDDLFCKVKKAKTQQDMLNLCTESLGISKFNEVDKRHKRKTGKTKMIDDKIIDVDSDDETAGTINYTEEYKLRMEEDGIDVGKEAKDHNNLLKWQQSKKYLKNKKKKEERKKKKGKKKK